MNNTQRAMESLYPESEFQYYEEQLRLVGVSSEIIDATRALHGNGQMRALRFVWNAAARFVFGRGDTLRINGRCVAVYPKCTCSWSRSVLPSAMRNRT